MEKKYMLIIKKNYTELCKWLNENGPFKQQSFRSLFRWFARVEKEYCDDVLKFSHREKEYNILLQAGYLLDLDVDFIIRKKELNDKKKEIDDAIKFSDNNDDKIKQILYINENPTTRLQRLIDTEIPELELAIKKCQIADNYREIEQEADQLKIQIDEKKKQNSIIDFQLRNIEKTLSYKIDVTKEELMELYSSLNDVFKPEALQTFENIQSFHKSLHVKRKERLLHDQLQLIRNKEKNEKDIQNLSQSIDQKLRYLKGKKAFDEFIALSKKLADLQEERNKIQKYVNFKKEKKQELNNVKMKFLQEDERTEKYLECNPLQKMDKFFSDNVKQIYPNAMSGIAISNNSGDNQRRFNLNISLSQDGAEGIAATKLRCFDLTLFLHGHCKATMNMLWHDNRLFADTSANARAMWFKLMMITLKSYLNKQYIASLNEENYNSMMRYFSDEEKKIMKNSIVITLSGDQDFNKLLGITFK